VPPLFLSPDGIIAFAAIPEAPESIRVIQFSGRVSEVDFGRATLQDLVGVTAGAKPRNEALSLFFSRRPQHGM
jgi:hypothetical protein